MSATEEQLEEIHDRGYEASEARAEAWRAVKDALRRAEYTLRGWESAELSEAEKAYDAAADLCDEIEAEYDEAYADSVEQSRQDAEDARDEYESAARLYDAAETANH